MKHWAQVRWVLKPVRKRSRGRPSRGEGASLGLPLSLTCACGPGHLQIQVSFLEEVLPELGKVRKGGKVSARENSMCKDREAYIAWLSVQTFWSRVARKYRWQEMRLERWVMEMKPEALKIQPRSLSGVLL